MQTTIGEAIGVLLAVAVFWLVAGYCMAAAEDWSNR